MQLFKRLAAFLAAFSAVQAGKLLDHANDDEVVPNSYIVVLKDSVSANEFKSHVAWATDVHHANVAKRGVTSSGGLKSLYEIGDWKGYSGSFDEDTVKQLVDHEHVCERECTFTYA